MANTASDISTTFHKNLIKIWLSFTDKATNTSRKETNYVVNQSFICVSSDGGDGIWGDGIWGWGMFLLFSHPVLVRNNAEKVEIWNIYA